MLKEIDNMNSEKICSDGKSLGICPENHNASYTRMDKYKCWLEIAKLISLRSHDSVTQHGCILIKEDRIISSGFNGYPIGFPDAILPNIRPHKNRWMIHAELNCLLNAAKNGVSTLDSELILTGRPCPECLKALIQAGIKKIYMGNKGYSTLESDEVFFNKLVELSKINIVQL